METFIVRIYRGGTSAKQELAGTVEHVGSGDRVGFSGCQQLLDCLLMPERGGAEHHTDGPDGPAELGDSR